MASEVSYRAPGEGRTLLVGSDYFTGKATGEQTGEQYTVYEVEGTPGLGPPLHRHAWHEFFYVLKGEVEFDRVVDGEVQTIGPSRVRRSRFRPELRTASAR